MFPTNREALLNKEASDSSVTINGKINNNQEFTWHIR